MSAKIRLDVAEGKDPVAERKAERGSGTFAEIATRYVEEHAKRRNKSWKQADYMVRVHLLPAWGRLSAKSITRSDVRAIIAKIAAPITANQVLAAASAIFSWAVNQEIFQLNPVRGVERNATKSRERILSDKELPLFWAQFDTAGLTRSAILKTILLTGQRRAKSPACAKSTSNPVGGSAGRARHKGWMVGHQERPIPSHLVERAGFAHHRRADG